MTVDADPFADPDTAAAEESDDFLTNEELIGRNLIVVPKEIETIKAEAGSTWPDGREKKDYNRVTADIIILDGRRIPKIRAYPQIERNKYISAFKVVKELKKYVPGSGDPEAGKPVLGYFCQVNKAYFLAKPDDDARKLARGAWKLYTSDTQKPEPPF